MDLYLNVIIYPCSDCLFWYDKMNKSLWRLKSSARDDYSFRIVNCDCMLFESCTCGYLLLYLLWGCEGEASSRDSERLGAV